MAKSTKRKPASRDAKSPKQTKAKKPKQAPSAAKKVSSTPAKKARAPKASLGSGGGYRLNVGDRMPDFRLLATGGREIGASDLRGAVAVLYFYPKDNTPGCTLEGHDFRTRHEQFRKAGARIFGVSADSVKSHEGFKSKCGFPFDLLSDEGAGLARAFDVMQMKSMYGRTFEGIERSTFVIDAGGVVRAAWRKVKVAGHADEVLAFVKALGR